MIPSPEPDTYGPYARASAIADYVELLALKHPVRRATVADFIADNDWNLDLVQPASRDPFSDARLPGLSDRLDAAHDDADIVYGHMGERSRILRERYPFSITDEGVSVDTRIDPESSPYVALLSLTIAHAFQVTSALDPVYLFEQVVTRILCDRGLPSVGLAALRRSKGDFELALGTACAKLGLIASPNAAPRLRHAHDEGVDVLCHIPWEEPARANSWVLIGQATVARSETWIGKFREPSPMKWAAFVGIRNLPLPFLAVPHHVERPMMERLDTNCDGVVLDRLRLVRYKRHIGPEERRIIRSVVREEIEPLTG